MAGASLSAEQRDPSTGCLTGAVVGLLTAEASPASRLCSHEMALRAARSLGGSRLVCRLPRCWNWESGCCGGADAAARVREAGHVRGSGSAPRPGSRPGSKAGSAARVPFGRTTRATRLFGLRLNTSFLTGEDQRWRFSDQVGAAARTASLSRRHSSVNDASGDGRGLPRQAHRTAVVGSADRGFRTKHTRHTRR